MTMTEVVSTPINDGELGRSFRFVTDNPIGEEIGGTIRTWESVGLRVERFRNSLTAFTQEGEKVRLARFYEREAA